MAQGCSISVAQQRSQRKNKSRAEGESPGPAFIFRESKVLHNLDYSFLSLHCGESRRYNSATPGRSSSLGWTCSPQICMTVSSLHYPFFGPEIECPHCRQPLPALTLTDSYLCQRHGAFEANAKTRELVHIQSGRQWRRWEDKWYRQHTHPDGIRFEIHEALDQLYSQGSRATRVTIAHRYRELLSPYLNRATPWSGPSESGKPKLYGLEVDFSSEGGDDPRWEVINFCLDPEPGLPMQGYPRLYG
jgi:uncharacterized protein (TIGR02652 family)